MFVQCYTQSGLPLLYFIDKDSNQVEIFSEYDVKIGTATLEDYTFFGLACKKLSIAIDENYFTNSGESYFSLGIGFTMLNGEGEVMGYSSYEAITVTI